jgi:hypothetical protein
MCTKKSEGFMRYRPFISKENQSRGMSVCSSVCVPTLDGRKTDCGHNNTTTISCLCLANAGRGEKPHLVFGLMAITREPFELPMGNFVWRLL